MSVDTDLFGVKASLDRRAKEIAQAYREAFDEAIARAHGEGAETIFDSQPWCQMSSACGPKEHDPRCPVRGERQARNSAPAVQNRAGAPPELRAPYAGIPGDAISRQDGSSRVSAGRVLRGPDPWLHDMLVTDLQCPHCTLRFPEFHDDMVALESVRCPRCEDTFEAHLSHGQRYHSLEPCPIRQAEARRRAEREAASEALAALRRLPTTVLDEMRAELDGKQEVCPCGR